MASITAAGTRVAIAMRRESAALSTLSDAMMISRENFRSSSRGCEARALDEGQIGATAVLLALRDDQLLVGEGANHRPHLYAEFARRPQAAMAECDLDSARCRRASDEQGLERSGRAARMSSQKAAFCSSVASMRSGTKELSMSAGSSSTIDLPFDELLLDFLRALYLLGDAAKRVRYRAECTGLLDRCVQVREEVARVAGRPRAFVLRSFRPGGSKLILRAIVSSWPRPA